MRKATKKTKRAFQAGAKRILEAVGAVPTPADPEWWALDTRYGLLTLHIDAWFGGTGPGTVFTRFDDPQRATGTTGCNPYSGKWNHHYFEITLDDALYALECNLRSVLPAENPLQAIEAGEMMKP